MNAERAFQQLEARERKVYWFARRNTFSRAGDLRESLLHVGALSGTSHNAGVEGSSPSLSTNRISVIPTDAKSAWSP